ncbi:hypothetical protein CCH79_00003596, partial [Gambusia affinis]
MLLTFYVAEVGGSEQLPPVLGVLDVQLYQVFLLFSRSSNSSRVLGRGLLHSFCSLIFGLSSSSSFSSSAKTSTTGNEIGVDPSPAAELTQVGAVLLQLQAVSLTGTVGLTGQSIKQNCIVAQASVMCEDVWKIFCSTAHHTVANSWGRMRYSVRGRQQVCSMVPQAGLLSPGLLQRWWWVGVAPPGRLTMSTQRPGFELSGVGRVEDLPSSTAGLQERLQERLDERLGMGGAGPSVELCTASYKLSIDPSWARHNRLVLVVICFHETVVIHPGEGVCKRHEVSAALGSSVVLPCNFLSNDSSWVEWTQEDRRNVDLVRLSSKGRILYLNPRSGRVKTFPIQASERNYSIIIDELQNSDIGSYYCKQSDACFEVKLSKDERKYSIVIDELQNSDLGSYYCEDSDECFEVQVKLPVDKSMDKGELSSETYLLISICTGAAALILLTLLGYFCYLKCNCPSAPQLEGGVNGLPTENDDQYLNPSRNPSGQSGALQHGNQPDQSGIGIYPNLDEFKFQREESQKTKQRFHLANQGEIRRQQAMAAQAENNRAGKGRRKPKD